MELREQIDRIQRKHCRLDYDDYIVGFDQWAALEEIMALPELALHQKAKELEGEVVVVDNAAKVPTRSYPVIAYALAYNKAKGEEEGERDLRGLEAVFEAGKKEGKRELVEKAEGLIIEWVGLTPSTLTFLEALRREVE